MSLGDHGTQSSWCPLKEIHYCLKGLFVWAAALLRIATACKVRCIKYLSVLYSQFVTWMYKLI